MSALCLISLASATNDYENEFFQGMESGFFLRENPEGYKDYDCPALVPDEAHAKIISQVIQPIELAV